jgi:hypothetical protein
MSRHGIFFFMQALFGFLGDRAWGWCGQRVCYGGGAMAVRHGGEGFVLSDTRARVVVVASGRGEQ